MTTPSGNQEQISRAAAERNALHAQFQGVYRENLEPIYRYVLSWVGNREDAEDLTSRIFLKAVEGVDYERPPQDDPPMVVSGGTDHARRSLA